MAKQIELHQYNSSWPIIYENRAKSIKEALNDNLIEIHHIGSTSVPSLSAKPCIDIIGVVQNFKAAIPALESIGYESRGEMHLPFREYYRHGKEVNLHLYEKASPEVNLNIAFRNYLRAHPECVKEYQELKDNLLKDSNSYIKNNSNYTGYNLGKDAFIRSIIAKTDYDELRLMYCNHHHEWQQYHLIRKTELFDRHNIVYNPNHPTVNDHNCYHFVFYKKVEIIGVAMIQFLADGTAALRSLATVPAHRNKGYARELMLLLEKWVKIRGKKVIKLHSALDAEHFYRKLGYVDVEFDDKGVVEDVIDLGKELSITTG